jgi:hypothetical protein
MVGDIADGGQTIGDFFALESHQITIHLSSCRA